MRALTILQPWLDCICFHGKRIENRTWHYPLNHLGNRIALHAGKRFDRRGYDLLRWNERLVGSRRAMSLRQHAALERHDRLGLILATAVVTDCIRESSNPWFVGPFGWVLEDVEVLKAPVFISGAQGLWRVPQEVEEAVKAAEVTRT